MRFAEIDKIAEARANPGGLAHAKLEFEEAHKELRNEIGKAKGIARAGYEIATRAIEFAVEAKGVDAVVNTPFYEVLKDDLARLSDLEKLLRSADDAVYYARPGGSPDPEEWLRAAKVARKQIERIGEYWIYRRSPTSTLEDWQLSRLGKLYDYYYQACENRPVALRRLHPSLTWQGLLIIALLYASVPFLVLL